MPQITEVAGLVGDRTIDHLLLSVGLNEFGFADIIHDCAANLGGPACVSFPEGTDAYPDWRGNHEKIARLSNQYDQLARAIQDRLPEVREIYLNDYPAEVFRGGACDYLGNIGSLGFAVSASEGAAMTRLGVAINREIRLATGNKRTFTYLFPTRVKTQDAWNYVGDMTERFSGHAYCPREGSFFLSLEDSLRNQGNKEGTAHPNAAGHREFRKLLIQAINRNR